jgi:hypothetical protein
MRMGSLETDMNPLGGGRSSRQITNHAPTGALKSIAFCGAKTASLMKITARRSRPGGYLRVIFTFTGVETFPLVPTAVTFSTFLPGLSLAA